MTFTNLEKFRAYIDEADAIMEEEFFEKSKLSQAQKLQTVDFFTSLKIPTPLRILIMQHLITPTGHD